MKKVLNWEISFDQAKALLGTFRLKSEANLVVPLILKNAEKMRERELKRASDP